MHRLAIIACVLWACCATSGYADPNLAAFLDGVVSAERQNQPFAGAVVAVVQDGRVLTLRGYGYADIDGEVAVDSEQTLFRVGSVSKAFLWLRLLQLIEAGEVSLESDVRDLVMLPQPLAYDEPLTVEHLMTHRSGFEDRVIRLFAQGSRTAGDLRSALHDLAPRQVARPGSVTAYSNYATALAALVVEAVSGEPWADSIERHVFAPTGARSSSYAQPLPPELAGRVAAGYRVVESDAGPQLEAMPFEYFRLAPAGSLSTTGSDMARLMIALLEPERGYGDAARLLTQRLSVNPTAVSAATHGLYERPSQGVRAVAHDGSLQFSHARMVLWPDERTGLFVAANDSGGNVLGERLEQAFAERAGLHQQSQPALSAVATPELWTGHYITTRRARSTPASLGALVDWVTVSDAGDGGVWVDRPDERFLARELNSDVLQQVDGASRLGRVRGGRLVAAKFPLVEYERASEWLQPHRQAGLIGGSLIVLVLFLLSATGAMLGVRGQSAYPGRPFATFLLAALGVGWLVFFVGFGQQFANMEALFRGEDARLQQLLWLPPGLALASVLALLLVLFSWLGGNWTVRYRLLSTLAAFASLGLAIWCAYWRLLPPPLASLL